MAFQQTDFLNKATCVTVSVYSEALTYGKMYEILAWDKSQVKVRGDNGRTRWYPSGCFDMTGRQAPRLLHIHLSDPIEVPFTASVDVNLEFSDGQRRWCSFITPEILSRYWEKMFGTERLLLYGAPHIIVVSSISQEIIEQVLNYIESQGELFHSTKLIE